MSGAYNVCAIHGFSSDFMFSKCPYCDIIGSNSSSLARIESNRGLSAELSSISMRDYTQDVENFQSIVSAINSSESALLQELEWGFLAVSADMEKMVDLLERIANTLSAPTQTGAIEYFSIASSHMEGWLRYRFDATIPPYVIQEELANAEKYYKYGFENCQYKLYYPAYIQIASMYMISNRPKEAIGWLERSLTHTNTTGRESYWMSFSWRLIGRAHYMMKDFAKARDALKNATCRTSNQAVLWYDYAKYCALGQDKNDVERCMKALTNLFNLNIAYWSIVHKDKDFDYWRSSVNVIRALFLERYRTECLEYSTATQKTVVMTELEMKNHLHHAYAHREKLGKTDLSRIHFFEDFNKLKGDQDSHICVVKKASKITEILALYKRQDEITKAVKEQLILAQDERNQREGEYNAYIKKLKDFIVRMKDKIENNNAIIQWAEDSARWYWFCIIFIPASMVNTVIFIILIMIPATHVSALFISVATLGLLMLIISTVVPRDLKFNHLENDKKQARVEIEESKDNIVEAEKILARLAF